MEMETDISRTLVRFLDTGVDGQEIRQLCRTAIAQRIREIKPAAAQAVVQARSCDLMDNPEGPATLSNKPAGCNGNTTIFTPNGWDWLVQ